ncbi:MAG: hypothetical protein R3Y59_10305 [bacterium]
MWHYIGAGVSALGAITIAITLGFGWYVLSILSLCALIASITERIDILL